MNSQSRFWSVHKSLYIFLCALLGMLLFYIIHRAVVLIWVSLIQYDPIYNLGLDGLQQMGLYFMTSLAAMFVGGWYGVWLGLYWHELVYERRHDEMERKRVHSSASPAVAASFKGFKQINVAEYQAKTPAKVKEHVRQPMDIRKPHRVAASMPTPAMTMPVVASPTSAKPSTKIEEVKPKPKAKKKAVRKTAKKAPAKDL